MAEPSRYADTFRLIDANGDGRISAEEFKRLMDALGDSITDDAANEAVRLIDADGDGEVTLDEFAGYLEARS
ncbi:MAG TPA: EF-hand domain-containing protein [Mycobacteriales bacterium]|nr:EF-hand domain-containing protein [Mycobacteriales bacterium]